MEGGSLVVLVVGGGLLGFSVRLTLPMLILPAKEGTVFLPPSSTTILGTLLSLMVFALTMASAVLFLFAPLGPGHPSHPSWVSRMSPSHVG